MADVTKTLKDAAYVTIGFGVIAFQKAQVRRQELTKQLEEQRRQLETQAAEAREQFTKLLEGLDKQFQPVIDEILMVPVRPAASSWPGILITTDVWPVIMPESVFTVGPVMRMIEYSPFSMLTTGIVTSRTLAPSGADSALLEITTRSIAAA